MTTTNRYRAGGPPPLQLHRGAPLDLPADDDQAVETVEQFANDAASIAWVGWLLLAALFTFVCMGIGYMAGRYFS